MSISARHRSWFCALLIAMLFSVGSCERQADNDGRVHLVMATPAGLADRPHYEDAVREFGKDHPNIDVEILEIPGNYYQKLLVMIAGGNAPDLMWMGQGFGEFARREAFLDVSEQIARDVDLSQFNAQACGWYRLGGKQYAVPFGLDLKFMVYNKKLFDEAGLPYPTDDWTYDDFLDKAKKLTRDTNGDGIIDTYGFRGELDVALFDAQFVSDDGLRATCDSPGMLKYLQTNYDLAAVHGVAPAGKQMRNESIAEDLVSLFQQESAAIMQVATWNVPFLFQRCKDMRWALVTNPKVVTRAHWASSQAMMISSDTRHPDEAWAMARMFLADGFQRAAADRIVPTKRAIAEEALLRDELKPYHAEAMLLASDSMEPFPRVANLAEIQKLWTDACESVWMGRATPAEAAARAQRDISRTIRTQQALYQ
jgi:multiple sugar transport system substrate-binding protein